MILILLAALLTLPAIGGTAMDPPDTSNPTVYHFVMANPDLTPGAVFSWATKSDVCTPGYTTKVRKVPFIKKMEVFKRYGISFVAGAYEVDHLISLELGGSNDITNLWPEAYEGTFGARQKDVVENYLHRQVCKGNITLKQAQDAIKGDWVKIYRKIKGQTDV